MKKTVTTEPKTRQHRLLVLIAIIGYLAIDLFPVYDRIDIARLQFFYLNIVNGIVGLLLLLSMQTIDRTRIPFWKNSVIIAYLAFITIACLSGLTANNASLGILRASQLVVSGAMTIVFVNLFKGELSFLRNVATAAAFIGAIQAITMLSELHAVASTTMADILEGNAGNPNIFAASMLWKIPLIVFGIASGTSTTRWMLSIALLPITTSVLLINARSALLSLILLTVACTVYFMVYRRDNPLGWKKTVHLAAPLLLALLIANIAFQRLDLAGRYSSTASRILDINPQESSAQARLLYWQQALIFATENPLKGIGLGNWMIANTPHMGSDNVFSVHTHNDFLEVTAESGIFNGLLYLTIFILLLVTNLRRIIKPVDMRQRMVAFLALLLLLVYGVDATFNFPLYRPTMQVCFAVLMGLTLVNTRNTGQRVVENHWRIALVLLAVVALLPLYTTYHADQTSLLENRIVLDDVDANTSTVLTGDQVIAHTPKIPNVLLYTSASFAEYTGIYYLREKRYAEAIHQLDIANTINPYFGRPDFYKYIMANERKMSDSAYYYLNQSFQKAPSSYGSYREAVRMAGLRRDTAQALSLYDRYVTARRKPNASALEDVSWALQAAGYPREKILSFLKSEQAAHFAADTTITKRINDLLITDLLVAGQQYFNETQYDLALKNYRKALEIDPTNIYAMQNIGFHYFSLGKPGEAIPYIHASLKKPGLENGKSEYYLALCYQQTGNLQQACYYATLAKGKQFPGAVGLIAQTCSDNR